MKKQLLLLIPVFLLLTAFIAPANDPKPFYSYRLEKQFDINDWIIDEQTANRMIEYYGTCKGKCRHSLKQVRNLGVKRELEKTYKILSVKTIKARYTSDDMPRYRKARGFNERDGKGDIDGFATVISRYEVAPKNGFLTSQFRVIYTDEYTICPPPDSPPCD